VNELITVSDTGDVAFNVDPDPLVARAQIRALTEKLLALPASDQADFPVEHVLVDGMYMRKLFIAKGRLLVGKIHLKECINFVEKGDISVMTETGSARVKAGFNLVSPAGIQKVGYAHEDTIFINVFRTDETDIDKIEAEIATEDYDALVAIDMTKQEALCQ
jgi:hypothetical protein